MAGQDSIRELKQMCAGYTLLYVEDNEGLQQQAAGFYSKFFGTVRCASDGEAALKIFEEEHPDIIISDIKMPKMDGIEMARIIRQKDLDIPIIFTTAHNETDFLHQAVRLDVSDYIVKPLPLKELAEVLYGVLKRMIQRDNSRLFSQFTQDAFNYQNNIVFMVEKRRIVVINTMFKEFFDVESAEEFEKRYFDLGDLLMQHGNFLWNRKGADWFKQMQECPGRLFNAKITSQDGSIHHFIMKMTVIPNKEEFSVITLDDVTELNLLELYDDKASKDDKRFENKRSLQNLLELTISNQAVIKINNFYKGLVISNDGMLESVEADKVTLQSKFLQLHAIKLEGKTIIDCELFPSDIMLESLHSVNFDAQQATFKSMRFFSDPDYLQRRKYIRVEPEGEIKVTLFIDGNKFFGELHISDISINTLTVESNAMAAGIEEAAELRTDFILPVHGKPSVINCPVELVNVEQLKKSFRMKFEIALAEQARKGVTDYIAARQMELIKEFKGRQNG